MWVRQSRADGFYWFGSRLPRINTDGRGWAKDFWVLGLRLPGIRD
jgi:hypothetical protein